MVKLIFFLKTFEMQGNSEIVNSCHMPNNHLSCTKPNISNLPELRKVNQTDAIIMQIW